MSLFDADDEVESVLFVHREISGMQNHIKDLSKPHKPLPVYRVPPLESMDGYKELAMILCLFQFTYN